MTTCAKKLCFVLFNATILAISGLACAQTDLDRQQAIKAITESEEFRLCSTEINSSDTCNWGIYTGRWTLIADRWGSSAARLQPDNLKGNPVGYWLYKEKGYLQISPAGILTLSDEGRRIASKQWTHVTAPGHEADTAQGNYERWDVPLATKRLIAVTSVLKGWRLGVQFAEVHYLWSYVLTPLGSELFKNKRLPSTGRNVGGWVAPAELTGIDPTKTYSGKAIFVLQREGWRLSSCKTIDACD